MSDVEVLYITYEQNGETVLEKSLDDEGVEVSEADKTITVRLSQEETLLFESEDESASSALSNVGRSNRVRIQIRWRTTNDCAYASDIIVTSVKEILKDGEI